MQLHQKLASCILTDNLYARKGTTTSPSTLHRQLTNTTENLYTSDDAHPTTFGSVNVLCGRNLYNHTSINSKTFFVTYISDIAFQYHDLKVKVKVGTHSDVIHPVLFLLKAIRGITIHRTLPTAY